MPKGKFLDLHRHLPSTIFVTIAALFIAGFVGIVIYTGVYTIGADAPHYKPVAMMLDQVRERAIKHHARNIVPPADLDDPKRVTIGAGLYNEMCTSCHLAPGMEASDLSKGLYPQAPELARGTNHTAAEQFWIIKHGIKLSAMPAWGQSHTDDLMWDMVAFLRKLEKMSPDQYKTAVANAPSDEEAMEGMPGMSDGEGAAAEPAEKPKQAVRPKKS